MGFRQLGKALPYLLRLPPHNLLTKAREEEQRRFSETIEKRAFQEELKLIKELHKNGKTGEALQAAQVLASKYSLSLDMGSQLWSLIFDESKKLPIADDALRIEHKWVELIEWKPSYTNETFISDLHKSEIAAYPVRLAISANVANKQQLHDAIDNHWPEIQAALRFIQPKPRRSKQKRNQEVYDFVVAKSKENLPYAQIAKMTNNTFDGEEMDEDRVSKILKERLGSQHRK